jgi:hypothetical protein
MKGSIDRRILMLCYYFPPLLDVGCKRSVGFAKYLQKHGWAPYVLSVKNPDRHYCMVGNESPPPEIPVTYTSSLLNASWILGKCNGLTAKILKRCGFELKCDLFHDLFSIPDRFIGWVPGAILKGYRIINRQNIDYIYVSCPPFSSALAGSALKRLSGRPLVVDFRDPYCTGNPYALDRIGFRRKVDSWVEKIIIEAADVLIVSTEEVRKGYLQAYPELTYKTFTIHNGFDHEAAPSAKPDKLAKFTIVYGGNMYLDRIDSTSFFEALALLKQKRKISSDDFQFLYFGIDKEKVSEIAEHFALRDLVTAKSSIPHQEMLKILHKAHLQLLRIVKPMISTKLFEGIAMNLPFLATIPDGEVAGIIGEYSPSSRIVNEDSAELVADSILMAMQDYRCGLIESNHVAEFLDYFSRENTTTRLESIIEKKLCKRLS